MRVLARPALRRRRSAPRAAGRPRAPARTGGPCPGGGGRPRRAGRPIRCVGLNDVIGSWNTIASEVPSSCRCAVGVGRRAGRSRAARAGTRRRGRGRRPGARSASAVRDLPEPDSPTTPTASPRRTAKVRPADRADRPVRAGEGDLEVADVEDDVGGRVRGRVRRSRWSRGRLGPRCTASGRRSAPTGADAEALGDRLAEEVERQAGDEHGRTGRQRRGRVDVDGSRGRRRAAGPSRRPADCTPRPRKDRPAKASSAPPAPIVALTTSGSAMLGSTCRSRIRARPTPATRAAAT